MYPTGKQLVLFGLFTSAIWNCGCNSSTATASKDSSKSDLPKVATVKVERKNLVQKTVQPGQIEAFYTTPVFAKVAGYVDIIHVDIGDRVTGPKRDDSGRTIEPGQTLVRLSAPEVEEELRLKDATIELVAAEVEQSEIAVKMAIATEASVNAAIDEARAGLERADANLNRWKSEYDRIRDLSDKKTVTLKLAEEAEQQYKSAQASRTEIEAKIRAAHAKHQEVLISIEKSRADLKTARARLNMSQVDRERIGALVGYLDVKAPHGGVVTTRNVDPGVLVQPPKGANDTPMLTIVQADTVRLFVEVPESDAILVETGRPVQIRVPAAGTKPFAGTVTRTGWALQTGNRTLKCEIDIPNSEGTLRPGMYAHVELVVAQRSDVLTLPKTAIVLVDGQSNCLTVSADGLIAAKAVQIGIRSETDVEIVAGLDGSETVISANAAGYRAGQRVELMTH